MDEIKNFLNVLNMALDMLYHNDQYLIYHGEDYHVSERSITHKLGAYLAMHLEDYDVDCEYNRAGDTRKEIKLGKGIIPDIIIHKRGTDMNNFVAIEVKPWWNANFEADIKKLKKLTKLNNRDSNVKYKYGISLAIYKTREDVDVKRRVFNNGKNIMIL